MDKLKAFWKFFLSFFKTSWQIEDYPLKHKVQEGVPDESKYCIQVINWWTLCGLGATKEKALKSLKEGFEAQVKSKGYTPRPGTNVPIQFAKSQIVNQYHDITDDFIEKVLGFSVGDPVFISDESSLYEFSTEERLDDFYKKIQEVYNIDVSDIKDGKISKIIERIASKS